MTKQVLSLNASVTGYSIYSENRIKESGIWNFSTSEKNNQLYNTLCRVIEEHHISTIVIEEFLFDESDPKSLLPVGETNGVIDLVCSQYGIQLAEAIQPVDHKFLLTGTIHANKEQIKQAVSNLGYPVQDVNEANAISILLAHLQFNRLPVIHPVQNYI